MRSVISTFDDILARCVVSDRGCWIWQGYSAHGRPEMRCAQINRNSRLSLVMHAIRRDDGPVPAKRAALIYYPTRCKEMLCCNPAHHSLINRSEINRITAKLKPKSIVTRLKISTATRKIRSPERRLSDEQIAEIEGSSTPLAEISERYGISMAMASIYRRGLQRNIGYKPMCGGCLQGASVFSLGAA